MPQQQTHGTRRHLARRIGHHHGPVLLQVAARQRFPHLRQRMRGRHGKHEVEHADRLRDVAAARRPVAGRAHEQVGAPVQQRFPRARQGVLRQAQARLLRHVVKGAHVVSQSHGGKHGIDADRQFRFPAGRHPAHAVLEVLRRFQ
ncbi:hypothetical protein D3C81_1603940 [compost metagenome]